jgi:hypothetical protein
MEIRQLRSNSSSPLPGVLGVHPASQPVPDPLLVAPSVPSIPLGIASPLLNSSYDSDRLSSPVHPLSSGVNESVSAPHRRAIADYSSSLLSSAAEQFKKLNQTNETISNNARRSVADFVGSIVPGASLAYSCSPSASSSLFSGLNESLGFPSLAELEHRVDSRAADQLTKAIQDRMEIMKKRAQKGKLESIKEKTENSKQQSASVRSLAKPINGNRGNAATSRKTRNSVLIRK